MNKQIIVTEITNFEQINAHRYANKNNLLALKGEKEHALRYLNISLSKNEIDVYFVEKDEDWRDYLRDNEFIKLLKQYKG